MATVLIRLSTIIRQKFSLHSATSGRRVGSHPAKWETCIRRHPANTICTILTCVNDIFFPLDLTPPTPLFFR